MIYNIYAQKVDNRNLDPNKFYGVAQKSLHLFDYNGTIINEGDSVEILSYSIPKKTYTIQTLDMKSKGEPVYEGDIYSKIGSKDYVSLRTDPRQLINGKLNPNKYYALAEKPFTLGFRRDNGDVQTGDTLVISNYVLEHNVYEIRTLDNRAKGQVDGVGLTRIGVKDFKHLKRNTHLMNTGELDPKKYYAVAKIEFTLGYGATGYGKSWKYCTGLELL